MKNRSLRTGLVILIVLFLLMAAGHKAQAALDFSGSFRSDLAMRQYEETDGSPLQQWGDKNTLRLNFKDMGEHLKMEGSFDLMLLAWDDAESYLKLAGEDPSGTQWVPLVDTRKLYLSLLFDRSTFTLGRQIINYGVGYVFSPIDCFSTVDLKDIGLPRKGSDIFRVQIPLGDLAGVEGVTTLAANSENTSAVKVFGNIQGYDLSLTGIYKSALNELLIGFTFKGDLVIGIHGELVAHCNSQTNNQYYEYMAGADYSFDSGKLLLLAEYYYNGMVGHYLFWQANYVYDEIRTFTINGIHDQTTGSWVGTFQFAYNILQNTNLFVDIRYFNGDLTSMGLMNSPRTEYGIGVEVKF